jgi:hypothetical protein
MASVRFFITPIILGKAIGRRNPNARNFMSRELFERYLLKEDIKVLRQKVINWGNVVDCDCLSLVERTT